MRILATSDLHYTDHMGRAVKLAEAARRVKFDILIIAGDIASGNPNHYRHVLPLFGRLSQPKLAVFGNHDLWVSPEDGDSLKQFDILTPVFEAFGFSVLDSAPAIIDNVGFVGNVGWYDYSFRRTNPAFAPYVLVLRQDGSVCRWDEMTDADYATKRLTYIDLRRSTAQLGNPKAVIGRSQWLDWRFVKLPYSDTEFTKICAQRLQRDIERIHDSVSEIVCVTHHVPFAELVVVKDEPGWDFANAFVGSALLGQVMLPYPKVKTAICGHTHRHCAAKVAHIFCCDVSARSGGALFLIDTEKAECRRVAP